MKDHEIRRDLIQRGFIKPAPAPAKPAKQPKPAKPVSAPQK